MGHRSGPPEPDGGEHMVGPPPSFQFYDQEQGPLPLVPLVDLDPPEQTRALDEGRTTPPPADPMALGGAWERPGSDPDVARPGAAPEGGVEDAEGEAEAEDIVQQDWVIPSPYQPRRQLGGPFAGCDVIGDPGSLLELRHHPATAVIGGHRPSATVDVVDHGRIVAGAASIRGAAHYDSGTVRQDSYTMGASSDGRYLIAVFGDGIGSGPLSHLGAEWACQQGLILTRRALDEAADVGAVSWSELSAELRRTVRERAEQHLGSAFSNEDGTKADPTKVSDKHYAKKMGTTAEVLVVGVEPEADGSHVAVRVVVSGDGTGLVLDPGRGWWRWGVEKIGGDGSIASNAVLPLPIDSGDPLVSTWQLEPGQAVVVGTDGIGDPLGDGATALGGYLHGKWASPVRNAAEFLRIASFIRLQADDDRTVVVVWACSN